MGEITRSGYNWTFDKLAEGELRGCVKGCGLLGVVMVSLSESDRRGRYKTKD